jgi:hypothetical protein
MDLAKVGEVELIQRPVHGLEPALTINKKLSEGWVLLSVKIAEERFRGRDNAILSVPQFCIALGKPREKPSLATREDKWDGYPQGCSSQEDEVWRREHLAHDDPDHPDFQLHAKGSS